MLSQEIKDRFLKFFEKRGHVIIPSASLIPEGDSSTLFTTAGMQPLVPYLLGQPHPLGKRLVNVQKCVRTGDIDEVGDKTHLTFFEMLGNWSLGDYFKQESITWSYEFLTSQTEGLGLDPKRLYITVFEGDKNAPRDTESVVIWRSVGIPEHRIYFKGVDDNWWSPGDNGPCGPDTEIFYDLTPSGLGDLALEEFNKADERKEIVEIWNNVFIEYEKKDGKVIGKLAQKSVDTGMGLERITAVMQQVLSVYDTDLFKRLIDLLSPKLELRKKRILADHIRAISFIITDGIRPSNKEAGYVLRRLIRRILSQFESVDIQLGIDLTCATYHPELERAVIMKVIQKEREQFIAALNLGVKELDKLASIDPKTAFHLYNTYGLPLEVIKDKFPKRDYAQFQLDFEKEIQKHQAISRSGAEQKFKGGLGDHSEQTIKLHTAHHVLLASLQRVLGTSVKQRGSNITPERLRIDFSFDRKMTDEEKSKVEHMVNEIITQDYTVVRREMPLQEAKQLGAEMEFGAKYPDIVSVYFIENKNREVFSKEFCGGPHVSHTKELGHFKIIKEEAVSAGVRRIKAVLE